MIKIEDFDDCPLSYKNGTYGGLAGDKTGILFNDELWMIKYPKNLQGVDGKGIPSYSNAPLSEFIGSHVYDILGYPVHETVLGERDNKLIVACKDFAVDAMLLEIRTILNHTEGGLAEFLSQPTFSSTSNHIVDLQRLLAHLDQNQILLNVDGIQSRFFEQSIVDILINNNDRNNGNWGILRTRNNTDCLAPVFANGSSFYQMLLMTDCRSYY